MPKNPESEGSRLVNLKQIEQEHGVSRSALHTYRRSASFPQPIPAEGSTKIQYRAEEVVAWFEANPPSQGKRTDLAQADERERPMSEEPLHLAEDTPMRPGYSYAANGVGVRDELIAAVLEAWANVSPTGDAALTLRSVNDGAINRIDNIARMAVAAVLQRLAAEEAGT